MYWLSSSLKGRVNPIFLAFFLIWIPFSIGEIDFVYKPIVASISIQYLVILLMYIVAAFEYSRTPIWFGYPVLSWLVITVVSIVFFFTDFKQLLQFGALLGAVVLASILISRFEISELVDLFSSILKLLVLLSILYGIVFSSMSFSYVNDQLSFSSFYVHKNSYGRFVFLTVLFLCAACVIKHGRVNFFDKNFTLWLILCLALLYISKSKSAMVLSALVVVYWSVISISSLGYFIRRVILLLYIAIPFLLVLLYEVGYLYFVNIGSALDCLSVGDFFCIPGTGRLTIWDAMMTDIDLYEKSVFGFGYGVYFGFLNDTYLSGIGLGDFIPYDPHNGFMEVYVNFGWIGLLVLSLMILSVLRYALLLCRFEFSLIYLLVAVILVANISESYFVKTTNIYTVLFMIILISASLKRKST